MPKSSRFMCVPSVVIPISPGFQLHGIFTMFIQLVKEMIQKTDGVYITVLIVQAIILMVLVMWWCGG